MARAEPWRDALLQLGDRELEELAAPPEGAADLRLPSGGESEADGVLGAEEGMTFRGCGSTRVGRSEQVCDACASVARAPSAAK